MPPALAARAPLRLSDRCKSAGRASCDAFVQEGSTFVETAQGSSGSGCTSDDLQDCSWRACCGLLEMIWAWDLSRGEQCLVDYAGNRDGLLRE